MLGTGRWGFERKPGVHLLVEGHTGRSCMTALGILLITMGLALVCVGLLVWGRAPHTEVDEPHEFRVVLDALQDEDRGNENAD